MSWLQLGAGTGTDTPHLLGKAAGCRQLARKALGDTWEAGTSLAWGPEAPEEESPRVGSRLRQRGVATAQSARRT